MAKQKCGTCRYFQEAGLAGSGWCHHPQRKVSSGVMIMVRRNELACRDEWSQTLWEPKEGGASPETQFQRPPTTGPAPPANIDDMRALVGANTQTPGTADEGEDVLLSEGRIVSETHQPPPTPEPPRTFPAGGFDPRTAVIRAREAYRERTRAREAAARQSAGAEALASPRDEGTPPDSATEPFHAAQDLQADTRPADQPNRPPLASTTGDDWQSPAEFGAQEPFERGAEWDESPAVKSQVPAVDDSTAPEVMASESEWSLEAFLNRADDAEQAPEISREQEPELALDRLDEIDETDLPAWFQTDLPRICRACRDYRPAAEGGRGWCANRWAFTHSRMVHEDDVAPCDSAIGDWWAPVDDVWLVAADVSSHGRATPLLDRLTARSTEQRRQS